ncbi:MAG: phage major capsid protein [Acidimicrobiales bacterium]|nr:phage major capsid protein [Acidimicrobiales bacterium]
MTLEELRAKRAALLAEAESLLTRAAGTDLAGDDAARFDAITAEVDATDVLITRHEDVLRMIDNGTATVLPGTSSDAPSVHRSRDPWSPDAHRGASEVRDDALAAIERTEAPDHAKATAERLVRTTDPTRGDTLAAVWARTTSNPAYLTAFQKVYADPQRGHLEWSDAERNAHREVADLQRAMSLTDANGGYMVPFALDPAILLTSAGSINPVRQIARVEQIVTSAWNGVSSAGVTASWDGEAAQVSDDAPSDVAQPSVTAWKGQAFIPFSIEVGMDAANFAVECSKLLVDAKDQLEAVAFVTGAGDGSNAPTGIVTALAGGSSEVAPTTPETFAAADLYKLQEAVPARFRPNARFMMALEVINKIRQFAAGSGQQHSFITTLGEGSPPDLLGWPLHENSNVDGSWNVAASADNFAIIAGDFSHYLVADRIGTTIELVPHLFGANGRPTGQRGYYMYFRTGADSLVDNAFRVLNIETTA